MEAPGGITKSVLESLRALPLEASTHDLPAVTSSAPSGGLASPTAALRSAVLRSTTLALAGRETQRPPMLKRQVRSRALDLRGLGPGQHLARAEAVVLAGADQAEVAHALDGAVGPVAGGHVVPGLVAVVEVGQVLGPPNEHREGGAL